MTVERAKMGKYEAVQKDKHKNHLVKLSTSFKFCKTDTLCPLVSEEIGRASAAAPVVFVPNTKNSFDLCMLLGLTKNSNGLLDTSYQWQGSYVPAHYRAYPFSLLIEEKSKEKVLCYDSESDMITDEIIENSKPLFNLDGQNSDHLNNILSFLRAIDKKRELTNEVLNLIHEYDLFVEWELQLKQGESTQKVKGLYSINKEKFQNLSTKKFSELRKSGGLEIIYSHFVSLFNLNRLVSNTKQGSENSSETLVDRTKNRQETEAKKNIDSLVQNLLIDN